MSEEANEHTQQAEANASQTPPPPPKFDPDPALVEVSLKSDTERRVVADRRKTPNRAP